MKQVIVLYADGFEEIEGVTPYDYLKRAGAAVTAVSCPIQGSSLCVTGSHGLCINADKTAQEALGGSVPDAIVCPGGMPGAANIAACPAAIELIQKTHRAGNIVAALCASPIVVLAKLGLLSAKTFTCFPGMESQVEQWAGAGCKKLLMNSKKTMNGVEIDGKLITGQAPGAAEEFAIALIGMLEGKAVAEKVRQESWLRAPRS